MITKWTVNELRKLEKTYKILKNKYQKELEGITLALLKKELNL